MFCITAIRISFLKKFNIKFVNDCKSCERREFKERVSIDSKVWGEKGERRSQKVEMESLTNNKRKLLSKIACLKSNWYGKKKTEIYRRRTESPLKQIDYVIHHPQYTIAMPS